MKKLFFLFVLLGTTLFITSCNDDNDANDGSLSGDNYVRLSVDGTAYEQTTISVTLNNQFGTEAVSIVAPLTDYNLVLNIPSNAQVGSTVDFDIFNGDTGVATFSSSSSAYFLTGEYTVTGHDTSNNLMTGNFSFDAFTSFSPGGTPALVITNGEFRVNY